VPCIQILPPSATAFRTSGSSRHGSVSLQEIASASRAASSTVPNQHLPRPLSATATRGVVSGAPVGLLTPLARGKSLGSVFGPILFRPPDNKENSMRSSAWLRLFAVVLLMAGSTAHAQLFRAYLASDGDDANPCTLSQPCRLLPAALAAVADGGEVWMLDSANYNTATVSITKGVTILAVPGALGSVVGGSGGTQTAIAVNAPGKAVTLKNIVIRAFASNADIGVLIGNAKTVTIEACTINGFALSGSGLGIWANVTAALQGDARPAVNVINTTVRDGGYGILFQGNVRGTVAGSRIVGNSNVGVGARSNNGQFASVSVSDTLSNQNLAGFYVEANGAAAQAAQMYVTRSVASFNAGGGFVTSNNEWSFIQVDASMASQNTLGAFINQGSGIFQSRGNNSTGSSGNSGTITVVPGT
jgi:hypothetical protein